jgi:hypothetical protein
MLTKLIETANALSNTFMPAEQAQRSAAIGAAQTLVIALETADQPGFQRADLAPAREALAHGVMLSVQADAALRKAHREFARVLPDTPLMENGWGCTSPTCGPTGTAEVTPLRSVA